MRSPSWAAPPTRCARLGCRKDEIDEYYAEATSGDYDHLLQTTMRWVDWQ
jgi:hypothetical protein